MDVEKKEMSVHTLEHFAHEDKSLGSIPVNLAGKPKRVRVLRREYSRFFGSWEDKEVRTKIGQVIRKFLKED